LIYIIAVVFIFIIFLVVLNFLRKLQWDAIHNNLLDLTNEIGGEVLRQGMLGRPIFHGKYKNLDITINFSTERSKKGRRNYIDISVGRNFKQTLTISALDWLKEREESALDEFIEIKLDSQKKYGLRSKSGKDVIKKNMQQKFYSILQDMDPFSYVFIGYSGLLFEKHGGNLAMSTKHPALKQDIDNLIELTRVIR
jgi:hypothetical protein